MFQVKMIRRLKVGTIFEDSTSSLLAERNKKAINFDQIEIRSLEGRLGEFKV